jgi:MFS transporter, YNFM family, putative membrane transport protein
MKALSHPTNRAMFFGGFSCFALLYCVQPLMPLLSHEFAITPAQSSLSLSLATAAMAVSLLVSSAISDRFGRKPLMVGALAVSAVMTLLCALASGYGQLLGARILLGVALGGMPAVAMAYLAEEIEPESLGLSMGLYISGSAFGGMVGRMVTSVLSDFFSWRLAMVAMGVAGVLAAAEFWRSLPDSRSFHPSAGGWRALPENARRHLSDDGLPWLFTLAFLLMGCMVSAYNYISYRLLAAPFELRQSVVGGISLLYLLGIFSSVWAGKLADRYGRKGVLYLVLSLMLAGIVLTLSSWLPLVVGGMALFTFAFFASHSMTSSWVGRRARGAALASALYLFFYYLGSSVVGWAAGILWGWAGWAGVVMLLASCLIGAVAIAIHLRRLTPIAPMLSQIKAEAG